MLYYTELHKLCREEVVNLVGCIAIYTMFMWKNSLLNKNEVAINSEKIGGHDLNCVKDMIEIVMNTKLAFYQKEKDDMLSVLNKLLLKPSNYEELLSNWKGPKKYSYMLLKLTLYQKPLLAEKYHYLIDFFQQYGKSTI